MKAKQNFKVAIQKDAEDMFENSAVLSDREKLFIISYIQTLSGPDAALAAGYTGNRNVLRSGAWKLLHKPRVRAKIEEYFFSIFVNVAEFKARLSMIARADFGNFIDIDEVTGTARINLAKAEERGMLGLIKKYRTRETINSKGERVITSELELYDAQEALVHIGRLHGLFNDHIVVVETSKGPGPFELMAKAYQDGIDKGEKLKKIRSHPNELD